MPSCPTIRGLSVRFATLDQNCFEDVNTYNRHIYRVVLSITGDIAGGGKGRPVFSASRQGRGSRQRVPSPSDPASEKVVCDWLDGIGRGLAPHTAHVAYGS